MNTFALTDWYKNGKIDSEKLLFHAFTGVFLTLPMGTSLPTIFAAIAAFIWIVSGITARLRSFGEDSPGKSGLKDGAGGSIYGQAWLRPVFLFVALPWAGLLYTPDPANLGIQYAQKTHYWIYCLAIASLAFAPFSESEPETNKPEKWIHAFLLGLAINASVGVLQFSGVLPMVKGLWYSGLERGYGTLTVYLVLGIVVASYYFREAREKKKRVFLGFLMMFYFFHLSILEGRAGYLMFMAISPMIAFNFFNKYNPLKLLLICAMLLGLLGLSPIVRDRISLSMEQITYHLNANPDSAWGRQYSDKQDRFYMWYGAVRMIEENPVFGIGTGGYQTALKERGKSDDPLIAHPHNDLLYMAVSFGMMGLLAFFWLYGEIIKNAWRQRHTPRGYFVLSAALVLLTGGMFNTYLLDAGTILLLAIVTGLQRSFGR